MVEVRENLKTFNPNIEPSLEIMKNGTLSIKTDVERDNALREAICKMQNIPFIGDLVGGEEKTFNLIEKLNQNLARGAVAKEKGFLDLALNKPINMVA